jgi:CDP-diacylglycerol--glycerol-3-phosphate 3-phosphatidyltransferase
LGEPPLTPERRGQGRPLTFRRLVGIDRSGGPPPETLRGQALHPWTIPNAIGFVRLGLIPVFLVLALDSGDGRDTVATILFAFIAWSDQLDGMAARITGQYSRLGALLDPVIDRLTVISGCVVCWHFDLLPKWELAIIVLREVTILVLAEIGLRRGVDVEINWLGRVGVAGVMAGIFFALAVEGWVPEVLFVVGLVAALVASLVYVRAGLARLRHGARKV